MGTKSYSSTSTNVSTVTTTNIRDIGFTGAAAIELASIIGATTVQLAKINAETRQVEVAQTDKKFKQLVSGSSDIIASGERLFAEARGAQEEQATLQQRLLIVAVLGLAGFAVFKGRRR